MQRVVVINDSGDTTKLLNAGLIKIIAEYNDLRFHHQNIEYDAVLISKKFFLEILSKNDEKSRTLTKREREVLRYKKNGLTNREIAEIMYITLKAVEKHTRNIKRKLGVQSITEALLLCRNITENPTIKG